MRLRFTVLFAAFTSGITYATSDVDPAQHVNPLIGTKNGGHVFPGATLPYGSVKAGPDSDSFDNQGGFVSDGSAIRGISQLHDDGTGGGASLGNFALLPLTSKECAGNNLTMCTVDPFLRALVHGNPTASPGFFSLPLENGVTAEVTVTQHVALHQFTYAAGTDKLLLLFDVTTDLMGSYLGDGTVTITRDDEKSRITGTGRFLPSFGEGSYQVFFCFDSRAFEQAKFYHNDATLDEITFTDVSRKFHFEIGFQQPAGVLMQFSPGEDRILRVRMGISWTNAEKACSFAEAEVPDLDAFDEIKIKARNAWNNVLGTIDVDATGISEDTQQLFWSSLYRTQISPTNITGDNPLWISTEPFYDSFYCIWDSFRDIHPLWAITSPIAQAEVIRALIDIYRNTGWLPDCRMSLDKGFTQGGSNADSVLSDSFVKGINMSIDWEAGFAAMVKDATVPGDFSVQGRGGIAARKLLGFVPVNDVSDNPPNEGPNTRSASRLLEYAYNDFGIALVAQGLGKTAEFKHYIEQSGDWENIWNPNVTSTGFSGFIQPRNADGSFYLDPRFDHNGIFDPTHCSPVNGHFDCFLNPQGGEFYEASSWEYSFYVPHDMARLIERMGGPETFSARLDTLFEKGYHDIGDEPGFLPTFLYNYVGQPVKTVDRVNSILTQFFNTSLNGLPGNDDSGAMGAYVVWAYLGFFPVAGQDTYLLSRPFFPKITIRNQITGAVATITAINFGDGNIYIQSAKLNGQTYTKNWISHELFRNGGTLELVMGPGKNSLWGTKKGDLPPSLSTGGFN